VFVYVNDLAAVLADVARVLAPRGMLAFTVETHSGAGVALLPTLRFAHSELYLRDAIAGAGLTLLALDQAAIRTEKGEPVNGLVLVAGLVGEAITVMPAHSRSQNGVAELVVGPATSGRTRWLAHVAGIHVFLLYKQTRHGWPEQDRP